MDVLGWLWWVIAKVAGAGWSVAWFLLGGWVVTLAQLGVIAGLVYAYKFGWRRAPAELTRHMRGFGGFVWAWARSRDPASAASAGGEARRVTRTIYRREFGDVNLSTLLSIAAIVGLGAVLAKL